MPSISVVIINHNYEKFVSQAIQSALNQQLLPSEIIVVDDGSTDGSIDEIRKTLALSPVIRLCQKENGGQLSAIRKGVETASGDWIFFLDSDDEWKPDHLSTAHQIVSANNDVSLYFSAHEESEGPPLYRGKWPEGKFGPCAGFVVATGGRPGTIASTLGLRKDFARKAISFDTALDARWRMRGEDCLIFGAAMAGAVIHYSAKTTVLYRIHGNNSFAGTDQSQRNIPYLENKKTLFDFWVKAFEVNAKNPPKQIYEDFNRCPENKKNRVVRRRFLRAAMRSSGFSPAKWGYTLKLIKSFYW